MLYFEKLIQAENLDINELPDNIKQKIVKLEEVEQKMMKAEEQENTDLLEALSDQLENLDEKITKAIQSYIDSSKTPKTEADQTSPAKEESEKGSNTGIILGGLALLGLGVAYFFGVRKK
jgi:hypothetical protein